MHFSEAPRLTQPEEKPKRPKEYSDDIAYQILERIGNGEKLHDVCKDEGYPAPATVYRWRAADPGFRDAMDCALMARFDLQSEQLIKIADDAADDYRTVLDKDGVPTLKPNPELIERTELRIRMRQYQMAKHLPRTYGEVAPQAVQAAEAPAALEAPSRPEDHPLYIAHQAIAAVVRERETLK